MLKCPHCNGLLAVTGGRDRGSGVAEDNATLKRLQGWLQEPVTLSDLLIEYGCNGNLSRFEPLNREVLRTAFRSTDAIKALGLGIPAEQFHYTVKRLPGWSSVTTHSRVFGIPGRWWVKMGYEHAPGFIEPDDDLV